MKDSHGYRTIVVGTDGSNLAEVTVRRAALAAVREQAALVIVCAFSELIQRADAKNASTLGGDPRVNQVVGREPAEKALAEGVALASSLGVTASTALIDGDAAAVLLQTVAAHQADLLVVGAVTHRTLAERLLGTVAEEVVKRATCDVLIVRPTEALEPATSQ